MSDWDIQIFARLQSLSPAPGLQISVFSNFGSIFRALKIHPNSSSSKSPQTAKVEFFTLRACPPTRLHAPYLHAPRYSRSVLASAMRMLTPWDPGLGTRDPRKGPRSLGPRGARGPFGPPGQGRLRRPWGPWGPLGLFRGCSEWVLFCGKLLWGCIGKVRSKQPIWK